MKITNKLGLPQPLVSIVESDYVYTPGRYSVTALLKGTREVLLERRYADKLEADVADMIWLIYGLAVHSILENAKESDWQIKEASIEQEVRGRVVSGRFDLYDEKQKKVTDWKTCSAWKVVFGDYKDWRKQLLLYAWLMRQSGFEVNSGEIIAFMRDHNKQKAKTDKDYPQFPVQPITFHFKESDFWELEVWLINRIEELKMFEDVPDNQLPLCTEEERWYSGTKYAVMKKGRKSALRVLESLEDAEAWMEANKGDYIDTRVGEDRKCQDYCSACYYCPYWREQYGGNHE